MGTIYCNLVLKSAKKFSNALKSFHASSLIIQSIYITIKEDTWRFAYRFLYDIEEEKDQIDSILTTKTVFFL